jgi:endonuclease/exonuclease/phosphatase family metal-dependent hydrolase
MLENTSTLLPPPSTTSPPSPMSTPIKILSYNVWLMPPIVSCPAKTFACLDISPRKKTRARAIALSLPVDDVDIIILCEAFCTEAVDILCEGLENRGFLYRTKTLGDEWWKFCHGKLISGGVVIVSRYPLLNVQELWFGRICARDDGLANKGCMRASIRLPGNQVVHVFATHTQAWNEPSCIETRRLQLTEIYKFVQQSSSIISPHDVVIYAGDMNVDRALDDGIHYQDMLSRLNCIDYSPTEYLPSFNHIKNVLASSGPSSGGTSELLDYILFSKEHRLPAQASTKVLELTTNTPYTYNNNELIDLSDHYPVLCEMLL